MASGPETIETRGRFRLDREAPRNVEVGRTLEASVPQNLGWADQLSLWGNVGVSLLGFTGAIFVLQPYGAGGTRLSIDAALAAIVLGTALGSVAIALAGLPGTRTGAPAMVLLRGLLGAKGSYLPTGLNILQCVGWGTFEVVVISTAAHTIVPSLPRDVFVVIVGTSTTMLAIYPLHWIGVLRRPLTVLMAASMVYLGVELLRHPVKVHGGNWSGFFVAMDVTIAVAVSWVPLASDYTRHSKSGKITVATIVIGYSVAQVACYGLGLLALITVASAPEHVYRGFIDVPLGTLAFAVLVVREIDQSFTDTYSTVVSVQNYLPRIDRRVVAASIGLIVTVLALFLDIADYENFLFLIGSVFVPLFGVLVVDFYFGNGPRWDLSQTSPLRPVMMIPWLIGFVSYQMINPGSISLWTPAWQHIDQALGIGSTSYLSASLISFASAAAFTFLLDHFISGIPDA
jgi:nucleobase:cation symporter-1, NCS1 family